MNQKHKGISAIRHHPKYSLCDAGKLSRGEPLKSSLGGAPDIPFPALLFFIMLRCFPLWMWKLLCVFVIYHFLICSAKSTRSYARFQEHTPKPKWRWFCLMEEILHQLDTLLLWSQYSQGSSSIPGGGGLLPSARPLAAFPASAWQLQTWHHSIHHLQRHKQNKNSKQTILDHRIKDENI